MFGNLKQVDENTYWKIRISILGGIACVLLLLFFASLPASIEAGVVGQTLLVTALAVVAVVLEFKRLNGHLQSLYGYSKRNSDL